jgi:hypothetical protein
MAPPSTKLVSRGEHILCQYPVFDAIARHLNERDTHALRQVNRRCYFSHPLTIDTTAAYPPLNCTADIVTGSSVSVIFPPSRVTYTVQGHHLLLRLPGNSVSVHDDVSTTIAKRTIKRAVLRKRTQHRGVWCVKIEHLLPAATRLKTSGGGVKKSNQAHADAITCRLNARFPVRFIGGTLDGETRGRGQYGGAGGHVA